MDLNSAEDSKTVKAMLGVTVVVICLGIGFHHALKRSLMRVSDSFIGGLTVVDHVDSIVNQLDRLTIDQRAFLSTGDDRFSENVVESIMGIDRNLESLEVAANKDPRLRSPVAELSHSINWVMDSMGKSFQIQQTSGAAVAIALLDDDPSVDGAKGEARRLRAVATDDVFDRVRSESRMRSILNVLF
ncbi:MAG: CHASE3 domain-containing protein [Candidatus Binataceae bacterium]